MTAALECEVKACCSRLLQVRVTQNCRTEVLEHRQDKVLSKPRWDMSFREFYVIIRLIPTGVVLLSLRAGGSLPGKVHWEKDPGPASWGFNFANPNGGEEGGKNQMYLSIFRGRI